MGMHSQAYKNIKEKRQENKDRKEKWPRELMSRKELQIDFW
jgi:hypothetical protein